MKKFFVLVLVLMVFGFVGFPSAAADQSCLGIKDGVIKYSPGHYLYPRPIRPGFDMFGYNYQAHLFNGFYANVYLGGDGLPPYTGDTAAYLAAYPGAAAKWYWPYRDTVLVMKWNDPWIANTDCDGDGKLDRHFGLPSYIGSHAWETNHMTGSYVLDGKTWHWTYFCKIVAVPANAYKTGGNWYTAIGELIGPDLWGEFAIIEEISNDPGAGINGRLFISPIGPGFGKF